MASKLCSLPAKDKQGIRKICMELLSEYESGNLKTVVFGYEVKEPEGNRHYYWNGGNANVVMMLEMIKHDIMHEYSVETSEKVPDLDE